jgi:predicted lipoprotein with Yx(FWY)xxD motif
MPHVDESTRRVLSLRTGRTARRLAAVTFLAIVGGAHAQVVAERNGTLTSVDGKTLYTFDKDGGGKSNCTGGCAVAWPPFVASQPPTDGALTRIMREDGRAQWAYDGKPLYFFAGDGQPGDAKGDGVGGTWHVVKRTSARAAAADSGYYYKY